MVQCSGFLSDYEQLQPSDEVRIDYICTGPDFRQKIAGTTTDQHKQSCCIYDAEYYLFLNEPISLVQLDVNARGKGGCSNKKQ